MEIFSQPKYSGNGVERKKKPVVLANELHISNKKPEFIVLCGKIWY
jgi:hypothetical protein